MYTFVRVLFSRHTQKFCCKLISAVPKTDDQRRDHLHKMIETTFKADTQRERIFGTAIVRTYIYAYCTHTGNVVRKTVIIVRGR